MLLLSVCPNCAIVPRNCAAGMAALPVSSLHKGGTRFTSTNLALGKEVYTPVDDGAVDDNGLQGYDEWVRPPIPAPLPAPPRPPPLPAFTRGGSSWKAGKAVRRMKGMVFVPVRFLRVVSRSP
jgi:hypothetical protein